MKKTVTATEARVHFGELLRAVSEERTTYVVERAGKPQAVILSSEEYERLQRAQPVPDWRARLKQLRSEIQTELDGREPIDVDALIDAGRQERDDAFFGDMLRRESRRSSGDRD